MPEGCAIAVLHGDPAEPNADVLFRVPAGSSIPSHWHNSAERMVLVAGDMTVGYDGHEPASLHPGSYAYGPAKLPHTARCSAAAPCVLFIAFEGPVDTISFADSLVLSGPRELADVPFLRANPAVIPHTIEPAGPMVESAPAV